MESDGVSERLLEKGVRSSRTVHSHTPSRRRGAEVFPMTNDLRKSGIGAVGGITWGTHLCLFYTNQTEVLDVLIPYFQAGLEQNEFCVWEVFEPLDAQEVKIALELAWPGAAGHLTAGDLEIVPPQPVRDWEAKLHKALAKGYAGMRVNANGAWLADGDRRDSEACEGEFRGLIANQPMTLLCVCPRPADQAVKVLEAGHAHRFAIARGQGDWHAIETPEFKLARGNAQRFPAELEGRSPVPAGEPADEHREPEATAHHRAEQTLRAYGERSQIFFELGLVGMAIISPAKGYTEVNQRLCDILGYERHELMGMAWGALTHPDDLADDMRSYERLATGEVEGYMKAKRWIHRNGNVVYSNVSVRCRRREDGSLDYLAAMVEEIYRGEDHKELSGRERTVARLIGMGRTVKEVASALGLSEKTVSTYRARILAKLKLKTTAELIRWALKHRLAE